MPDEALHWIAAYWAAPSELSRYAVSTHRYNGGAFNV
jgi:hypothetical protein